MNEPALKDKKLTLKQRMFLKEYFKTGNARQSALKVYDCNPANAGSIANETLIKLNINIRDLMESKGLSVGSLIDDLNSMRKATKLVTSPTEPDKEWPDWQARGKAIDIGGKWMGLEKQVFNQQNVVMPIPILGNMSADGDCDYTHDYVKVEREKYGFVKNINTSNVLNKDKIIDGEDVKEEEIIQEETINQEEETKKETKDENKQVNTCFIEPDDE